MLDRNSFRELFLTKCAEEGLTAEEMRKLAEQITQDLRQGPPQQKEAAWSWQNMLLDNPVSRTVGGAAETFGGYLPIAALAAPPLAGGALGYAAAKATDIDNTTVKELQTQELINEYRRQKELIARKRRTHRV